MAIVSTPTPARPTALAPLPRLLAYAQSLGLERFLDRPTRGITTLSLALLWLVLAWRGSGRPEHVDRWDDPLLAALLGQPGLPCARTLRRGLARFSAKGVRAAVEAAYRAELPRRAGRVWASVDSHQIPYWGRGKKERFHRGWSGNHGRSLRGHVARAEPDAPRPVGYHLFLALDTDTGQVITFALADGRTRDTELIAILTCHLRRLLGRRLAGVVADCGLPATPRSRPWWRPACRSSSALPIASRSRPRWRPSPRSSGAGWSAAARSTWAPARGTRGCA